MAETWPAELQQRMDADVFQMTPGDPKLRTQMDSGVAKVRRRFTSMPEMYDVGIILPLELFDTFELFFKTTLSWGVNTFNFLDPLSNTTKEFRMVGVPSYKSIGGTTFKVTMQWELMP